MRPPRISCRACSYSGPFEVVVPLHVTAEVSDRGEQIGGAFYANEAGPKTISCPQCGHAWATQRRIEIEVDVR